MSAAEARGLQPRRDRVGGFRHVAGRRVGRVDFDELFVDLPRPRVVRSGLSRHNRCGEQSNDGGILHPPIIGGVWRYETVTNSIYFD